MLWYKHVACVIHTSSALDIGMKMGEKSKSATPSAIQAKNQWKTISTEEKLDIISQLEKDERILDICHNVGFTHISMHAICENADRITENAKSGTQVFV